jgi:hypothetical protein
MAVTGAALLVPQEDLIHCVTGPLVARLDLEALDETRRAQMPGMLASALRTTVLCAAAVLLVVRTAVHAAREARAGMR